jgi:acetoin utilization deacetylase AcuC-like enzyme
MPTAYITHPECLLHETGAFHPERAARLHAIEDRLVAAGMMSLLRHYEAPLVSAEQLCRVHDPDYVARLERLAPRAGMVLLDPDTPMCPATLRAAKRAAGAVVRAVELVVTGEVETAFCAVRPPGHHAERARAMGFCLFNNIAVGAAHALEACGLQRVAVVDFDVHHGNGTEALLGEDARVLFCSSFQHPYYPFTTLDDRRPNVIHTPLSAGAHSEDFQRAVTERWLPALERFAPEMILVSAGFDGHHEDELAGLNLLDSDYRWVTRQIMEVAARHAQGRVVSALEGGYALDALGRSAAAHIKGLMGQ